MIKHKITRAVFTVLFVACFIVVFILAGMTESEQPLNFVTYSVANIINFAIMVFAGSKAQIIEWR